MNYRDNEIADGVRKHLRTKGTSQSIHADLARTLVDINRLLKRIVEVHPGQDFEINNAVSWSRWARLVASEALERLAPWVGEEPEKNEST